METWRVVSALFGGWLIALPLSLVVADALDDAGNLGYPAAGFFVGVGLALLRIAGLRR